MAGEDEVEEEEMGRRWNEDRDLLLSFRKPLRNPAVEEPFMLAVDEEDDDALAASLREAVEPAMMQDSDRGLSAM